MTILAGLVLAVLLARLSMVDMAEHRLPDRLTAPLAALGLVSAAVLSDLPLAAHALGAVAGFAVLALFGEAFFRLRGREGLGLGDAKLLGAGGAWVGWQPLPWVVLAAAMAALVWVLATRRAGALNDAIPFGPFIAAALMLVWLFGAPGAPPLWR